MTVNAVTTGRLLEKKDYSTMLKRGAVVEISDFYTPNAAMRVVVERLTISGRGAFTLYTKDGIPYVLSDDKFVYYVSSPPVTEPTLPGAIVSLLPVKGESTWAYITRVSLEDNGRGTSWRYPNGSPAVWRSLHSSGRIGIVLFEGIELPQGMTDMHEA